MTIFSCFWHNKVVQLATSLVCNLLSKFDCQHSSASQFLARIVRWDQKYLSPWLLRFVSPTSSPRRDVDAEDSCSCLSFAGMTIETDYENLRNRQFIPNLSKNEYNFEYSYRNLMQVLVPVFLQICSSQAQNGGSDDARTVRVNTSYTTCELGAPGEFFPASEVCSDGLDSKVARHESHKAFGAARIRPLLLVFD